MHYAVSYLCTSNKSRHWNHGYINILWVYYAQYLDNHDYANYDKPTKKERADTEYVPHVLTYKTMYELLAMRMEKVEILRELQQKDELST